MNLDLESTTAKYESTTEYHVGFAKNDPYSTQTGLVSVDALVYSTGIDLPSEAKVRGFIPESAGTLLGVEEVPGGKAFGDASVVYKATLDTIPVDRYYYYGFINDGQVGVFLLGIQGTFLDPDLKGISKDEEARSDFMVLMQLQADRIDSWYGDR